MTKGLVPLKRIYDRWDKTKVPRKSPIQYQVQEADCNNKESPRIIRIAITCIHEKQNKIEELIREFKDMFSLNYDELKTYETNVINHLIPLKA